MTLRQVRLCLDEQALSAGHRNCPSCAFNTYRLAPLTFGARNLTPVGYAAFALGVTIGRLRRAVPAIAVTLAVFAVQGCDAPLGAAHLITPVRTV